MGSFPYPRNGIVSIDYEFILLFKKLGKPTPPKKEMKEASRMTTQEWTTYFSGHWNFGGVKQSGHLAMFPVELPTRLIKMFSFKNDTVLDPFLGSGTTTLAARNLERNSVGYEINEEFIEYTRKKLNITQNDIEGTQYQYLQDHSEVDYDKEIEQFPYTFTDFHGFNNKIDPKKLQFGSKIDKNSTRREKYYTVRSVISPELIQLNDGLQVKLLGVKKKESVNGQAIAFLNRKLTGQKVFLKFDRKKYDDNNTLLCYVYLKNMTFINAHLIKKGLAHVNEAEEFSYKDTFRKIEQ
jgi:site-specific DNA-methyltransferase (adenine-specific)